MELITPGKRLIQLVDSHSNTIAEIVEMATTSNMNLKTSSFLQIKEWLFTMYSSTIIEKILDNELTTIQLIDLKQYGVGGNTNIIDPQNISLNYLKREKINNVWLNTILLCFQSNCSKWVKHPQLFRLFQSRVHNKYIKNVAITLQRTTKDNKKRKSNDNNIITNPLLLQDLGNKRNHFQALLMDEDDEEVNNLDQAYKHLFHCYLDIQLLKRQRRLIQEEFWHLQHSTPVIAIPKELPSPEITVIQPLPIDLPNLFFTNATWEYVMMESSPTVITAIIGNEDLTNNIVTALGAIPFIHTCCLLVDNKKNIAHIFNFLNSYDHSWIRQEQIIITYGNFDDGSSEKRIAFLLSKLPPCPKKKVKNKDIGCFDNSKWNKAEEMCSKHYDMGTMEANDYSHSMDKNGTRDLLNAMPELSINDFWLEIGVGYPRLAINIALHYPMISVVGNDKGGILKLLLTDKYPRVGLPKRPQRIAKGIKRIKQCDVSKPVVENMLIENNQNAVHEEEENEDNDEDFMENGISQAAKQSDVSIQEENDDNDEDIMENGISQAAKQSDVSILVVERENMLNDVEQNGVHEEEENEEEEEENDDNDEEITKNGIPQGVKQSDVSKPLFENDVIDITDFLV